MNPIWAFIKTTRPVNLVIIAVTMLSMRYFVGILSLNLASGAEFPGISLSVLDISFLHFSLLTLIMILLAASGNLINDYFDVKVDRINKPLNITVGKSLKRRVAMISHHVMVVISILLGFYLGWAERVWFYSIAPVLISGGLWFYSFYLKKTFLLGNILVALVVSSVPIWAAHSTFKISIGSNEFLLLGLDFRSVLLLTLLFYVIQAYTITLFREIAKDAEDFTGDSEYNYKTLPVVWGLEKTKRLLVLIMSIWALFLIWIAYNLTGLDIFIGLLFVGLIIVPFGISTLHMTGQVSKSKFSKTSFWLKLTLAGGLLFSLAIPRMYSCFLANFLAS